MMAQSKNNLLTNFNYMHKFHYILFFLLSYCSFAQSHLFIQSDVNPPILVDNEQSQITLELDVNAFNSIKEVNPCELILHIPFFENTILQLNLESFNAFTHDFQLLRTIEEGMSYDDYQPDI